MARAAWCRRCGEITCAYARVLAARATARGAKTRGAMTNRNIPVCQHVGTGTVSSPEWALRIRAAYELGKRLNPEHDTTDYAEQTRYRPSIHRVKQTVTDARDNERDPLSLSAALTATVGGVVMAGHHHDK